MICPHCGYPIEYPWYLQERKPDSVLLRLICPSCKKPIHA